MDYKYKSVGDHSPSPPMRYTQEHHDHPPPPETTTMMSYTQNAPQETTAMMSYTQNAPQETTAMMCYTQNAPQETTAMMSYTQNAPQETTAMMSYTQNAPQETTAMMSYTQNAPLETTTMMSCTQNAPPETTTMMSYTQNAPPETTMTSYTQHHQSLTYFTQQAIRAGYVAPHFENKVDRIQHQPVNMHDAIWREVEKERIREEIIAEDIVRRRMLELEVRRELMMERQLAKQSGEGFSPFSSPVLGFSSALMGRGISVSRLGERNEIGKLEVVPFEERISENPFQQRSVEPKISALKPVARGAEPIISELQTPLEPSEEKDKIIFLAKPISGVKRKADTPPVEVANQPPSLDVPKKGKEDWSCALCQVSATSERGLNDHLEGKKHKSKEAALRAQKHGNYSIGLLPKKPRTINLLEANDQLNVVQMVKAKVELLPHSKSGEGSSLVILEKEGAKDNVTPSLDHHANDLEKSADAAQTKQKKSKKKKYPFWCATCRIGAMSEVSMEAHRNGKKHKARLLELSSVATSGAKVESAHTVNEALEEVEETAASGAKVESAHTVNEALEEVEETEAEIQEEVFAAGDN